MRAESAKAQRAWESALDKSAAIHWSIPHDLVAHFPLDGDLTGQFRAQLAAPRPQQYDADAVPAPAPKPVSAQFQEGPPQFSSGRIGEAASFDGKRFILGGDIGAFGFQSKFTLAAWIYPTADTGAIITRTKDVEEDTGYGLYLKNGKVQANLILRWLDDGARVETLKPIALNRWQHVMMTYDGSRTAEGIKIYVDGRSQELAIHLDDVNQNFQSRDPMRIGGGGGPQQPVPRTDRRRAGIRRGVVAVGMRRSSRRANRSPRLPASRPQREAMRRPRRSRSIFSRIMHRRAFSKPGIRLSPAGGCRRHLPRAFRP